MNYFQKEQTLFKKLEDSNYALFDGEKNECLDYIEDLLDRTPEYHNFVVTSQRQMEVARFRAIDQKDLVERIEQIDRTRHHKHQNVMNALSQLNRVSETLGLDPYVNIDTKDRYAVADFVGEYISEMYDLNKSTIASKDNRKYLKDLNLPTGYDYDNSDEFQM